MIRLSLWRRGFSTGVLRFRCQSAGAVNTDRSPCGGARGGAKPGTGGWGRGLACADARFAWCVVFNMSNGTNEIGPGLGSGAGVCTSCVLFFRSPESRGDGSPRRRPGYPGGAGLVIRLCPDHSGLPHPSPDATAPLGAPCAASSAIGLVRLSDRGRLVSAPHAVLLRE